jgi:UDP-N-acetyl-D-galactosamine dehydrogenase
VLILGLTFKEDCPDVRNSKVIDIVRELQKYHACVDVFDPWANAEDVLREYGISLTPDLWKEPYDAVIVAVAHREFKALGENQLRSLCKETSVVYDVKGILPLSVVDARL